MPTQKAGLQEISKIQGNSQSTHPIDQSAQWIESETSPSADSYPPKKTISQNRKPLSSGQFCLLVHYNGSNVSAVAE